MVLGDYNFVGYQHSLPSMGGIHEKAEEQICADLKNREHFIDQSTILMTHSSAYGILDVGIMDAHAGSTSILDLVRRHHPLAHIHGRFGCEERHFNVAADGTKRAVLIDFCESWHTKS